MKTVDHYVLTRAGKRIWCGAELPTTPLTKILGRVVLFEKNGRYRAYHGVDLVGTGLETVDEAARLVERFCR